MSRATTPHTVPALVFMQRTPPEKRGDKIPGVRWGNPLPAVLCCWDYASRDWQGCCSRACLCTCVNAFDPLETVAHTATYLAEHPQNDARVVSFLGTCVAMLGRGVAGSLLRRGVYAEMVDKSTYRESELASYVYGSWCLPCAQIQATSVALAVYRARRQDKLAEQHPNVGEVGCCTVDGYSYGPLQEWYYTLQAEGVPGWQCCQCCCCPTVLFTDNPPALLSEVGR